MLHLFSSKRRSLAGVAGSFRDAVERGDLARTRGDWPVASASYAQALGVDDSDSALWVQFAHALKEGGALDAAIEAYRTAANRNADCADARLHLAYALKRSGALGAAELAFAETLRLRECPLVRSELRSLGLDETSLEAIRKAPGVDLAFDVTDLVRHIRHARILTGIQRVQVDLVEGLTERGSEQPTLVAFDEETEEWSQVPVDLVRRIAQLAARSGTVEDADWRGLLAMFDTARRARASVSFSRGATLLNLGTSWWLSNYFLAVRRLQQRFAIRYVPFVHDLIPLVAGEHCTAGLRGDFLRWLSGVFDHADGFVVNSQATKADLLAVAASLGRTIVVKDPVRLDGRPRTGRRLSTTTPATPPFVLFVSTIESRKNHLMVFDAWLGLIRERGEAAVPDLVCVGSKGWMAEAALGRLAASPSLARKVRMLRDVGDAALSQLYADCLFTLYPSVYEGWGLPVTEALANGKVPLVAEVTSLPEAGGAFAVYFDPRSARDFEEKLRRLLDDAPFREEAEARIADGFSPRPWSDVAGDLLDALPVGEPSRNEPFALEYGAFHHFGASAEPTWPPDPHDAERYRTGTNWGVPGPTGCEAGPGARLTFRLTHQGEADGGIFVCVALQGPGGVVLKRLRASFERNGAVAVALDELVGPHGATLLGFSCMRCDDAPAIASLMQAASFNEIGPLGAATPC